MELTSLEEQVQAQSDQMTKDRTTIAESDALIMSLPAQINDLKGDLRVVKEEVTALQAEEKELEAKIAQTPIGEQAILITHK